MRVVLASKLHLGVAVVSAAIVSGGCQQGRVVTSSAVQTAPLATEAGESTATTRPVASAAEPPVPISQTDVINWAVRGETDDVIVDRIDHARATFHLSAGEEMQLRNAGVSDQVVMAMKATVWN